MISKLIITTLAIGSGILMMMYTRQIKGMTGAWGWAEQHLGNGGTYTAIKLLGVCCIVFAFMYMSGGLESFFVGFGGQFFGIKN